MCIPYVLRHIHIYLAMECILSLVFAMTVIVLALLARIKIMLPISAIPTTSDSDSDPTLFVVAPVIFTEPALIIWLPDDSTNTFFCNVNYCPFTFVVFMCIS